MKRKRGVVLIVVLVVAMMLALGAYTFATLMRTHRESSVLANRQAQAKLIVDSGVDQIRMFLMQSAQTQSGNGGKYDNPQVFRQIPVIDSEDPLDRAYFAVVAPALDDNANLAGVRFGLEDESTRLNLNMLLTAEKQQAGSGRQLLMALPGMTEDVADAILDWIDEDDEAREYGAEADYYMSLEPPYQPKNGPLDTVEELLRVRGVTPQLLLGTDTNRNGQIDPNELAGTTSPGGGLGTPTASPYPLEDVQGEITGSLDRGWSSYLTLYSAERNLTPEGQPRIYLNQPDLQQLHTELSQVFPAEWANFIVAYRQGTVTPGASPLSGATGQSTSGQQGATQQGQQGDTSQQSQQSQQQGQQGNNSQGGNSSGNNSDQDAKSAADYAIDFNLKAKNKFTQVLDLIDAQVQVKFAGEEKAIRVKSPFRGEIGAMAVYMGPLMDYITVNPEVKIPGRININQAPAAVLRGIPGMTEEIVEQILTRREAEVTEEKPNRRHETWLLAEGVVTLTEMKLLQPFICSTGHVHRGQIVGYFQSGEASARAEAIFDATGTLPRVVLWRDMSHLGRGYALETLGIDYSE